MSTCFGLFLFTRILIPDVMLTASMALSMWAFLRAIDEDEPRPRAGGPLVLAASLGTSLVVQEPDRRGFSHRRRADLSGASRGRLFQAQSVEALHRLSGLLMALAIAAPWHMLAALRNPPYFDFTMRSVPGEYHGFLWFYFINEQIAAVFEPALSARLQYGAARCISGCSICCGCFPGASIFRRW